MKKIAKVFLVSLLLLLVASCTTFKAGGLSYGRVEGAQTVGTFERTITVWKFLGSSGGATLFNVSQDSTDDKIAAAINREITDLGGDAAIGVSIEQKASFVNMLINGFTGDLLAPVQIKISGTVIKYE